MVEQLRVHGRDRLVHDDAAGSPSDAGGRRAEDVVVAAGDQRDDGPERLDDLAGEVEAGSVGDVGGGNRTRGGQNDREREEGGPRAAATSHGPALPTGQPHRAYSRSEA